MAPEISVIVPIWNERLNVIPLIEQIFRAFAKEPRAIELLLVDDSSTDGTWEQILQAQQVDARVRALRLLSHSGQSAAVWTGFNASRGSILVTLDGDLQNDPADLPKLLAELPRSDLVCGVRMKRMDNSVRRISSRIARWARKRVLGVDFRDTGCSVRALKRSVLPMLFGFDGLHRFLPILAHFGGAIVLEIPISHRPRIAGKSKYGVWNRLGRGICDLAAIAWYRRRQIAQIPYTEQRAKEEAKVTSPKGAHADSGH